MAAASSTASTDTDVNGELLVAILCKNRHACERAVAARHGRELGRERRGRGWQHGHDTVVVVYLGHGRAPRRSRATAALQQRLRPSGGAGEVVES